MQAVCAGSQGAYATLVTRHSKSISHYAYRMLGSNRDTEDITQETFLRMWTQADRYQPGKAKLSTWLHRIAHNLCVDFLRKHANMEPGDQVEEHDEAADSLASLENSEMLDRLNKALMSLPENQRSAITLCHLQNFSNQEAADIMNMSVKALESALSRARRTLRQSQGLRD